MLIRQTNVIKPMLLTALFGFSIVSNVHAAPQAQATNEHWIADKNNKCLLWNSYPKPNETVVWSGACEKGYASGLGIAEWYRDGRLTSLNLLTLEAGFWYGKRKTWDVKGNPQFFFAFKNQPPVSITEEDYYKMSNQQIFEKYGK